MRKFLIQFIFIPLFFCSSDSVTEPLRNYSLTVKAETGGSVNTSGGNFEAGELVTLSATASAGYVFTGWSNGSTKNPLLVSVFSNQTITAVFEEMTYSLLINTVGEGTVSETLVSSGRNADYTSGSVVKLTAEPSTEWNFVRWSGDYVGTDNPIEISITEEKNITAIFENENIEVNDENDYMGLKDYALAKGKYIGNLMRDGMFDNEQVNGGLTDMILKSEYNAIVLGNKMKMSNLLRTRPEDPFNIKVSDINTTNIDRFIDYADRNGMRKRGHVMVWHNQIPTWLKNEAPNWSAQQIYDFSKSYIIALSTYCAGKIDEWDVLNEAIVNNGFRGNTWYDKVNSQANSEGNIGFYNYFSYLFKWAREGDPNVELFYNDYNIEPFGTSKNIFMRNFVKKLKSDYAAPIDGVGLQSHFKINQTTSEFIYKLGQTIDDLGDSGFTANITELDIRICSDDTKTVLDQKEAYKNIVLTAFSRENCKTILIWGSSDNDSWIPSHYEGCGQATPHDENFNKKFAYYGIQEALISL